MSDEEVTPEQLGAIYEETLRRMYRGPSGCEQNFEKRRRERQCFETDREMFGEARAMALTVSETTQSESERSRALTLIAWIDARQGARS